MISVGLFGAPHRAMPYETCGHKRKDASAERREASAAVHLPLQHLEPMIWLSYFSTVIGVRYFFRVGRLLFPLVGGKEQSALWGCGNRAAMSKFGSTKRTSRGSSIRRIMEFTKARSNFSDIRSPD